MKTVPTLIGALCERVGVTLCAAMMRSQDGFADCAPAPLESAVWT